MFFVLSHFLSCGCKFVFSPNVKQEIGQAANSKIKSSGEHKSENTGRKELINQGDASKKNASKESVGVAEVRVCIFNPLGKCRIIHDEYI
jgi:hypothetical protein